MIHLQRVRLPKAMNVGPHLRQDDRWRANAANLAATAPRVEAAKASLRNYAPAPSPPLLRVRRENRFIAYRTPLETPSLVLCCLADSLASAILFCASTRRAAEARQSRRSGSDVAPMSTRSLGSFIASIAWRSVARLSSSGMGFSKTHPAAAPN